MRDRLSTVATSTLFVYERAPTSPRAFVAFWSATYKYKNEDDYTHNIGRPHTPKTLRSLFAWKIGQRFADTHLPAIDRDFISRMNEAAKFPPDGSASDFLRLFPHGGLIYRIFWIHCWQPDRFPIYDQHVHRAMTFIEDGKPEELRGSDTKKLRTYLDRYLPFNGQFDGLDRREVDRALWAFGKFIKSPKLPIE